MNLELPNWFLVLGAISIVVWIFAGIQVFRAAKVFQESLGGPPRGGRFLRFGMPPSPPVTPPDIYNDPDWWKRQD